MNSFNIRKPWNNSLQFSSFRLHKAALPSNATQNGLGAEESSANLFVDFLEIDIETPIVFEIAMAEFKCGKIVLIRLLTAVGHNLIVFTQQNIRLRNNIDSAHDTSWRLNSATMVIA